MAQIGRPGLTAPQKNELWERVKAGESFSSIGRALGKHAGSIHSVVAGRGGIAPRIRQRAARALTSGERERISRGLAADDSVRALDAEPRDYP